MRWILALPVAALAFLCAVNAEAQERPVYYCDPLHVYYPTVARCPVPWRAVASAVESEPRSATIAATAAARPKLPPLGDGLDDWCAKASLPSSIAICSDRDLRALVIERQHAFDEVRSRLTPDRRKTLLANQTRWVKTYPRACGLSADKPPALPLVPAIKDCMAQAGRERIAYLKAYGTGEASNGTRPSAAGGALPETPANTVLSLATTASAEQKPTVSEPHFFLPPEAELLPAAGDRAYCQRPDVIGSIIDALGGVDVIKRAGVTVLDFKGAVTTEISVKEQRFSCHGVAHLSNGQMLPGTFTVARNDAGRSIWTWVNDAANSAAAPAEVPVHAAEASPQLGLAPSIPGAETKLPGDSTVPAEQSTPIENKDMVSKDIYGLDKMVEIIRSNGYRCDSVSGAWPKISPTEIVIYCNHSEYAYRFVDVGRGFEFKPPD